MAPGGFTPHHEHAWEHEIFILKGDGVAVGPSGEKPFRRGDVIFILGGEKHQIRNTSAAPVEFLCLIPAPK